MSLLKPVVDECTQTYKNILKYVQHCRNHPDQELIEQTIILCDLSIETVNLIREFRATTGPQKQSCFFTVNLIKSHKDDLLSIIIKLGGNLNPRNVKWLESEMAFESSIRTGIIKNVNHLDSQQFFADAKTVFAEEIKKTLGSQKCSLKVYTVLEAIYVKEKGEDSLEELKHFRVKTFPIFMVSNLEKLFIQRVIEPTLKDMDEFQEEESGWRLKRIELLNVIISKYNPMRCGTFVKFPDSIANEKACLNIQN